MKFQSAKMDFRAFVRVMVCGCLIMSGSTSDAQKQVTERSGKKVIIATVPSKVSGVLAGYNGKAGEIKTKVSFTVTAVNPDDTLTGDLTITLIKGEAQKITQLVGTTLAEIPASAEMKGVVARFENKTACPEVRIDLPVREIIFGRQLLVYDRLLLNFQESRKESATVICAYANCLNKGCFGCKGLRRRLNELICGTVKTE
ncbi:MAG TPA: hypothetical protein VFD58_33175 [Blastocatellia bacterium]|nr:hypothetical protein [Blastocatellia bacterium]